MSHNARTAISRAMRLGLGLAAIIAGAGSGPAAIQAQDGPTVAVSENPTHGWILTDPTGMTLYTWAGDEAGVSHCSDRCPTSWPPLLTAGEPVAPAGLAATLGAIARDEGSWQVTLNGWPLYYNRRDTEPGDTNGHGSSGFGALWSVAMLGGMPPAAAEPQAVRQPQAVSQPEPPAPTPTPRPAAPPVSTPARAATTAPSTAAVTIVDFQFRPASLTIQIGDTVTWTNMGPSRHTTTSDSGVWDSGVLRVGQSASFAFNTAGTYPYFCAIHPNMRGTVTVGAEPAAAPAAPTPGPARAEPALPRRPGYDYGPGGYGGYYPYYGGFGYGYGYPYYGYHGYGLYGGYGYPYYGFGYPYYGSYGFPYYGGYGGYGYGYGYPYYFGY